MRKQKIHCEYPMASASATVLWNAISTASGLQGWFADKVTVVHKLCTFQWGEEETRQATILYIQPGCCIRFRWKDEDEPGCFFEMKLTNDELTVYINDNYYVDEKGATRIHTVAPEMIII